MKKVLLALSTVLALPAFAVEFESLSCEGTKGSAIQGFKSKVYVDVSGLKIENNKATIKSYKLTVINDNGKAYEFIPNVETSIYTGKNIENVPYKGTKYTDHLKFELANAKAKQLGENIETANLIVAPAYTVVKTIPQENYSDKSWHWEVEVREHSAVLDWHVNDHHGDYLPLKCYSQAHVNDSRDKKK